jgi:hypothetical protein
VTDSANFTTPEADGEDLSDLLLEVLPGDGTTIGNMSAREALSRVAERQISEEEYEAVKERALALGMIRKGRGRGGAIGLAEGIPGGSRYEAPSTPTPRRSTGGNGVTPEPTFQIGQKLTLSQLEGFLWKSAATPAATARPFIVIAFSPASARRRFALASALASVRRTCFAIRSTIPQVPSNALSINKAIYSVSNATRRR